MFCFVLFFKTDYLGSSSCSSSCFYHLPGSHDAFKKTSDNYLKRGRANTWRRQCHPTWVLLPGKSHGQGSLVGCSPWGPTESDTTQRLHFHFSLSLEKEMATHSSVLAWRIPGTGKLGGLPSMGSYRVGHDWSNLAAAAASEQMF